KRHWSAPTYMSPTGVGGDGTAVAIDPAGDAVAAWARQDCPDCWTVQADGLDAAGPVLGHLRVRGRQVTRTRLSFAISASDVWAGLIGRRRWSFGDGTGVNGLRVKH